MFIAIGGPQAHVTLSMTGTLFHSLLDPKPHAFRQAPFYSSTATRTTLSSRPSR